MVSSSKILTVSYGTFSCTAEGFEDPLAVVKESTNFFRGVVREDRFFGAEPPQFDPELAAQLMQAQISAEAQSGRLVLRGPLADAAMPAAEQPGQAEQPGKTETAPQGVAAAQAAAEVVGPDAERGMEKALAEAAERAAAEAAEQEAEEARQQAERAAADAALQADGDDSLSAEAAFFAAESDVADRDAFEDDYDDEALGAAPVTPRAVPQADAQPLSEDSVAAKLRRIRAVVSGGGVAAAAPDLSEDQDGGETIASVSAVLGTLAADTPDTAPARRGDEGTAELEPEDDQIDLAALRDDMRQAEDAPSEEDIAEAEPEAPAAPFALTKDFAAAPEAPFEDAGFDDVETDDVEADEVAEPVAEAPTETVAEAPVAAGEEPKAAKPRRVRVVKVTRAAFDAAVASGSLEEVREQPSASSLSAEDEQDLARELEAVKAELAAGVEDEWDDVDDLDQLAAPAAAREAETPVAAEAVLADLEAEGESVWAEDAFEEGLEDDVLGEALGDELEAEGVEEEDWDEDAWDDTAWDDEDDDEDDLAPTSSTKADDVFAEDFDDDDLADDVADAEEFAAAFDTMQDDTDDEEFEEELSAVAQQDVRKAVKLSSPARVMLTETSVEDNDTSRILNETNTQLEEPEGNRRRSAIAHLRAAVAATRADRLLGRKKDAEEQAQPYREDLADVVRPRRPAPAPQAGTERPAAEAPLRPAPLKLVAEQRVSETVDAPQAPLRPRRVTLADLDDQAPAAAQGDFAAYAESVGAHDLPELLEAAASYLSYIEGRTQFSRPQLMTKVRQVEGQDSSREDRLRSFGQLLRDGKIEKTGGGRFTVSERISFKPSARAAG